MCLVEILPAPAQRALMLDVVEWDPALGDYRNVQKPKLQPACQMPAVEGQEVLADSSPHVVEARSHVQEFLLLNHPVDCPICDQAGECKLQDYWLEHQATQKRMHDEPIHKPKAVEFGPTIVYDAERCVMCTRCIRFMDEVAKNPVLDMRERGNLNEVFVAPGRQLDGHYTFMTEHVCPVGALTTKDFRFKARVWFLRTAKSICQGCATGCNAHLDYDPRTDHVYRYRPRDNEMVNRYWMCDEGMLSYAEAQRDRVTEPRVGRETASLERVLAHVKQRLAGVPATSVAFLLSAQHSLEDNWALRDVARLVGSSLLFWSGQAPGYSDTILIDADKNPNTQGVKIIAPSAKPFSALREAVQAGQVTHCIALGGAGWAASDVGIFGLLQMLVVIGAHDGPAADAGHILLPATPWSEQNGTYVNRQGIRQLSERGPLPRGSAKPAWEHLRAIAGALGLELSWTRLKEIRTSLPREGASVPPPLPVRASV